MFETIKLKSITLNIHKKKKNKYKTTHITVLTKLTKSHNSSKNTYSPKPTNSRSIFKKIYINVVRYLFFFLLA